MAFNKTRTPIVYYGGKTGLWNYIEPLVPSRSNDFLGTNSYCESFCGGATVFWSKEPVKNETINDRLDLVINFYRTLKLNFKPLKRLIEATLIGRSIHFQALACIRQHSSGRDVDKVQLAWAFWVCTNFAYSNKIGGGYKYSNHMSVSVPETLKKRKEQFTELLVSRLEHAYIENEDALKVSRSRNTEKCFFYFDPPYPNTDQGHYSGYGWEEYRELLTFLGQECKGKFLLSSYDSQMLREFARKYKWNAKRVSFALQAPRKSGKEKTEILMYNY